MCKACLGVKTLTPSPAPARSSVPGARLCGGHRQTLQRKVTESLLFILPQMSSPPILSYSLCFAVAPIVVLLRRPSFALDMHVLVSYCLDGPQSVSGARRENPSSSVKPPSPPPAQACVPGARLRGGHMGRKLQRGAQKWLLSLPRMSPPRLFVYSSCSTVAPVVVYLRRCSLPCCPLILRRHSICCPRQPRPRRSATGGFWIIRSYANILC